VTTAKLEKLVRMANQIGDFYAAMPKAEAIEGAASHLRRFWTPKMIGEIIAASETGHALLNPTASNAIDALKRPPPT
jgi:formate dehydrogenase subunit delta